MTVRGARLALKAQLDTLDGLSCVPRPPRQLASAPAVYFAGWRKMRVAQGSVDAVRITLLVVVDNPEDFAFDELDDLTDEIDTLLDATRTMDDTYDLVPVDDGEWTIGLHEIGGQDLFGAMLDVEVHW